MEGVDMHTGVTPIKYMHGDSGSGELGDIIYLPDKTECDIDKHQVTWLPATFVFFFSVWRGCFKSPVTSKSLADPLEQVVSIPPVNL